MQDSDELIVLRGFFGSVSNPTVGQTVTAVTASFSADEYLKLGRKYVVVDYGFVEDNMVVNVPIYWKSETTMYFNTTGAMVNVSESLASGTSPIFKGAVFNPAVTVLNIFGQVFYSHGPIVSGSVSIAGHYWVSLRRLI
jgi:hypothetical protein